MICRLNQQYYSVVESYLDRDPLHNIFLIRGLRIYGLEDAHASFWGAFDRGQLKGVLFAHKDWQSCYGALAGDNPKILARLGRFALRSGVETLVGKSASIQPVVRHPPAQFLIKKMERMGFYEICAGQLLGRYDYSVRMATQDDVCLLVGLYEHYDLGGTKSAERIKHEIQRMMDEGGHYFLLEVGGRAVSGARVFPVTDRAGMVDAAITLPEFRGRGMYSCVRTACFEYLFRQGKVGLGLVSDDNAAMHKIVSKYGGIFTARWLIVGFGRKPPLRRRILPLQVRRWGLRVKAMVWRRGAMAS